MRDMPKFEVAVFNQEVRDVVKQGDHHREFEDNWADTHYIEVNADSEDAARGRMALKYPESKGFVIVDISPSIDL